MNRPLTPAVGARAIAFELRIARDLQDQRKKYSRGRSRPAKFNGRIVNWFGLVESHVVQPDRNYPVLRLGPGGSYERVFR